MYIDLITWNQWIIYIIFLWFSLQLRISVDLAYFCMTLWNIISFQIINWMWVQSSSFSHDGLVALLDRSSYVSLDFFGHCKDIITNFDQVISKLMKPNREFFKPKKSISHSKWVVSMRDLFYSDVDIFSFIILITSVL